MQVWDRLAAAGARYGIRPIGYRVLDSLRMEKGYRAFGSDLTAGDTPDEAGLGFCVALERKGEFVGRAAVEAQRARGRRAPPAHAARRRRARTSSSTAARPCWPATTVVGRVRSAAYGFTVGRTIASAYLPLDARSGRAARRRGARPPRARDDRRRTCSTTPRTRACGLGALEARQERSEILPAMLILLPNCECCDRDLPPESDQARICTYECTFCADCAENRFAQRLPELRRRPRAPADPARRRSC